MTFTQPFDVYLRQQTIAVTGGRGALGRRLIERLVSLGVKRIVSFDLLPYIPDEPEQSPVEQVEGDILSSSDLEKSLRGCTLVFHLAALINVGESRKDPIQYFKVNSLGTAQALEACRRLNIPRFIYTSTCHVYGIPKDLPITEDHRTNPVSMYAATKLAGETTIEGYAASYGLNCDIARLSNMFGVSYSRETALGLALNQLISGEPIALRNLASVRDFIHVNDVIEALLRLSASTNGATGYRIVNVSTGRGVSVREMADTLAQVAVEDGLKAPRVMEETSNFVELVPELVLDNSRLCAVTGWTPQMDLKAGLRMALRELLQYSE